MEAAGQDQVIVVSLEEKGNVTPGRKKTLQPHHPPFHAALEMVSQGCSEP